MANDPMAALSIRQAQLSDQPELAEMRALLWPDTSLEEHLRELRAFLEHGARGSLPTAVLVARQDGAQQGGGVLAGFLDVGLRSHADGCDIAQPVGFVEGWFVREAFRGRGVGAELMRGAEDWARAQGCSEMASDALIDNQASQDAHRALGFEVVDRCVHLRKNL